MPRHAPSDTDELRHPHLDGMSSVPGPRSEPETVRWGDDNPGAGERSANAVVHDLLYRANPEQRAKYMDALRRQLSPVESEGPPVPLPSADEIADRVVARLRPVLDHEIAHLRVERSAEKLLLSYRDAAALLRVDRNQIPILVAHGVIRAVPHGKRMAISQIELERLQREGVPAVKVKRKR